MRNWKIKNSNIEGKGVIVTDNIIKGSNLGTALITNNKNKFKITQHLGKWINHSDKPNCIIIQLSPGKYSLVTIKNISKGKEATMSYHETPWYIASPQTLKIPTKYKEKYGMGGYTNWWA